MRKVGFELRDVTLIVIRIRSLISGQSVSVLLVECVFSLGTYFDIEHYH